jgi:hypothetical protein
MADQRTHESHSHSHNSSCGHTPVQHEGHTDYLHDGHLHHQKGAKVEEHNISVTSKNPAKCSSGHECSTHDRAHKHGENCGHERVPHGDHVDYLVEGHLHHQHGDHCDNHGSIDVRAAA